MSAPEDEWRKIFEWWPPDLPKQGVLVTALETFGFNDFLVSPAILLVERDRPDALGSRKVMVGFRSIVAIKLADPGPLTRYRPLGFGDSA